MSYINKLSNNETDLISNACYTFKKINIGKKINQVIDICNKDWVNSIQKSEDYLYEVTCDDLDYEQAIKNMSDVNFEDKIRSCTSFRKGKYVARHFDYIYDENAEFVVHVPESKNRIASIGMASRIDGLTKQVVESKELNNGYFMVPFMLVDGMNNSGLVINMNVVPIDKKPVEPTKPLKYKKHILSTSMIPRFVLDRFETAKEAAEYLRDYVSIFVPNSSLSMNYSIHYMINDITSCYIVELIGDRIVILDVTNKPIMTNFYNTDVVYNLDGKVYTPKTQDTTHNAIITNKITPFGDGLERYNYVVENYDDIEDLSDMRNVLNGLKYTNAYKLTTDPLWYTEFVNINGLRVDSNPSEFESVIEISNEYFNNRSRNPESLYFGTWHTTHSVIYDIENKTMNVIVQENGVQKNFSL